MVSQANRHSWSVRCATLLQAFVWHHEVVEADYQPDPSSVTSAAPGQTPGTAPHGCPQPPQCTIPPFHERRLDRRSQLAQTQLLDQAAGTAEYHTPPDLHHMTGLVADFDHLGGAQVFGGHEPRFRLAPHVPTTPGTIDHPDTLEQRGRIGLPSLREKDGELTRARHDLREQRGRLLLRARSEVDPQEQPTPHGSSCMDPLALFGT